MRKSKTVIISPHLDDAVFSLGAALHDGHIGNVTIISVFSRSRYRIDGLGSEIDVTRERKQEDLAACRTVGAEALHLDLPDASLRGCYATEADYMLPNLVPEIDPIWPNTLGALRNVLFGIDWHQAFLPLGVGGHIDHLIARDAARNILRPAQKIAYFQDATYIRSESEIGEITRSLGLKSGRILRSKSIQQKMKLVAIYQSQVDKSILRGIRDPLAILNGERVWFADS